MEERDAWKRELKRLAPHYKDERLDQGLDEENRETLSEMEGLGIPKLPEDLVAFLATIDDGEVLNLEPIGGRIQHLHNLFGVLEANDPDEGQFGAFISDGTNPAGVVMIGYGMTQLLYDAVGALGPKGAYWTCQDMDPTDGKQIASSLLELLRGAAPMAND